MLSTILMDPDMQAPHPRFQPEDFCRFYARQFDTYIFGKIVSFDESQQTYCVITSHEINVTIYPAIHWSYIGKPNGDEFVRLSSQQWPDIIAGTDGPNMMLPPCIIRDRRKRARQNDDA